VLVVGLVLLFVNEISPMAAGGWTSRPPAADTGSKGLLLLYAALVATGAAADGRGGLVGEEVRVITSPSLLVAVLIVLLVLFIIEVGLMMLVVTSVRMSLVVVELQVIVVIGLVADKGEAGDEREWWLAISGDDGWCGDACGSCSDGCCCLLE